MALQDLQDLIASACEPFAHVFNGSKWLTNGTTYVHLAAMLGAGGLAIGADRQTLRLDGSDAADVARHVADQRSLHGLVVGGLVLAAVTGLMMFAADVETYFPSPLYWTKIGSVALLAANGAGLLAAERRLALDPADARALSRLRLGATLSLVLWFAVTLIGTLLTTEA